MNHFSFANKLVRALLAFGSQTDPRGSFERTVRAEFAQLITQRQMSISFEHHDVGELAELISNKIVIVVAWQRVRRGGLIVKVFPRDDYCAPDGRWRAVGVDLESFLKERDPSAVPSLKVTADSSEADLRTACKAAANALIEHVDEIITRC